MEMNCSLKLSLSMMMEKFHRCSIEAHHRDSRKMYLIKKVKFERRENIFTNLFLELIVPFPLPVELQLVMLDLSIECRFHSFYAHHVVSSNQLRTVQVYSKQQHRLLLTNRHL